METFRPDRDEFDQSNCLDEGSEASFLQNNIRRYSGNVGDFNKPNTSYREYDFKSFTLDIDTNNKSERPEWGEGKYQGKKISILWCIFYILQSGIIITTSRVMRVACVISDTILNTRTES